MMILAEVSTKNDSNNVVETNTSNHSKDAIADLLKKN